LFIYDPFQTIIGKYSNGELINTIVGHSSERPYKLVSLDETRLAIGFDSFFEKTGKTIRILNWETGGEQGKLMGHKEDVLALEKLQDILLASGSKDAAIKIWHWTSGRLKENLTGHLSWIMDLKLMGNFTYLVSCSLDSKIKLWNISNWKILKTLTGQSTTMLVLNNDNLASGYFKICIWNLTLGIIIRNITGHSDQIQSLTNIDTSRIASCARDWKIKIWSVYSGNELKTLSWHSNWVMSLVLLPNGHLVSASADRSIRIWDLNTRESLIKTIFSHSANVSCVALLANDKLASGSTDESVKINMAFIKIWHFDKNSTRYESNLNFL
jgi:WD40 repeat protein